MSIFKVYLIIFMVAAGFGASVAHSSAITSLTITDVNGDGSSGRFGFDPTMTSYFTGNDTDMGWGGVAQDAGSFSDGFLFNDILFLPYTYGAGAVGEITGGVLTISNLDFGGYYVGVSNYNLAPDFGTLVVEF